MVTKPLSYAKSILLAIGIALSFQINANASNVLTLTYSPQPDTYFSSLKHEISGYGRYRSGYKRWGGGTRQGGIRRPPPVYRPPKPTKNIDSTKSTIQSSRKFLNSAFSKRLKASWGVNSSKALTSKILSNKTLQKTAAQSGAETISIKRIKKFSREAKTLSYTGNGNWLKRHEGGSHEGHTIKEHVGKSPAYLRQRLKDSPKKNTSASSFTNLSTAQYVIKKTLQREKNLKKIKKWLRKDSKKTLPLYYSGDKVIGIGVDKDDSKVRKRKKAIIVLQKLDDGVNYKILTAYPE